MVKGMQPAAQPGRAAVIARRQQQLRGSSPAVGGAGGMAVVGGIGAILAGIAPLLLWVVGQGGGGMGLDSAGAMLYLVVGLGMIGFTMNGIGMFGVKSQTGGFAVAVGIFDLLAGVMLLLALLMGMGMLPFDMMAVVSYGTLLIALGFVFMGIWGFTAGNAVGAGIAMPAAIIGLLGGLALFLLFGMSLGIIPPDRDAAEISAHVGFLGSGIGGILTGVAMFKLR